MVGWADGSQVINGSPWGLVKVCYITRLGRNYYKYSNSAAKKCRCMRFAAVVQCMVRTPIVTVGIYTVTVFEC
jgi:hypothetical protein